MSGETKDSEREHPGEHIARMLAFGEAKIITHIFSFLTPIEGINYRRVCKRWRDLIDTTWRVKCRYLCLEQFWAYLGHPSVDPNAVAQFVARFKSVTSLCLNYCWMLTDSVLQTICEPLAGENVRSLSLFYCGQLTESAVQWIVHKFPKLTELNLGRCHKLIGDSAMRTLNRLPELRKLNLCGASASRLTEETFMILDDETAFPALEELDIQDSSKELQKYVDELRESGRRPHLRIKGPQVIREKKPTRKEATRD